jgi:voltage-gated potassium channel
MTFLLTAGTLGFYWVEEWPLFESFYMTLMTLTTVGYGEIRPLSFHGRIVASGLMLGGVLTVFIAIGVMVDTLINLERVDYFGRRRRRTMLEQLSNHYIVCGAGRVGRSVIRELQRSGATVVLIDNDPQKAAWGTENGILTVVGDATQDETLQYAHIAAARGLVAAISTDAENVYVTLSAHVLNPGLIISARATDEQAEGKLRRAGATTVFTPYAFIGHRLAHSMLRPDALSFLDLASAFSAGSELEIETEQLQVTVASPLCNKTIEESRVRQNLNVIVLALKKKNGTIVFNPTGNTRVESGDVLIAMGNRSELRNMETAGLLPSP